MGSGISTISISSPMLAMPTPLTCGYLNLDADEYFG
jgi:hypothetical protein